MHHHKRNWLTWLRPTCLLFVMLGSGATALAQATLSVLAPPQMTEIAGIKTIGVDGFDYESYGNYGKSLAVDVEAMLAASRVDGQLALNVVSLGPKPSYGTRPDPFAGRQGLLVQGSVKAEVRDESFTQKGTECSQVSTNKIAAALGVCQTLREVNKSCTKRTALARLNLRVLESPARRILGAKPLQAEQSLSACQGDPPLPSADAMFQAVYAGLLAQIRAQLLPTRQAAIVPVMTDMAGVSPGGQRTAALLLEQIKASRFALVCPEITSLSAAEPRAAVLAFAQGLCSEFAGNGGDAQTQYQRASQLGADQDPAVRLALLRTTGATAAKAVTVQQQAPQQIQPLAVSEPGLSGADRAAAKSLRRVAFVVGIKDYQHAPKLQNSVNDANDMAAALSQLGFEVIKVINATKPQFQQGLRQFARSLGPDAVALVYFAGHGIQVNGSNYLIPVDAKVTNDAELSEEAIDLNTSVLDRLSPDKVRMSVVILDACRDNPFAGKTRSARGGLATINAGAGVLVSFATAPGMTAQDGSGRNGVFTKHLLREMQVPGRKVEDVFKRVRSGVMADTKSQQTPWENSSLTGDFYFNLN